MPYIGNTPALDYISYAVQNFTVTAGTTSYALDYSVANENDIRLVINNVIQRPGVSFAYSATGTTLTLTSATQSGDTMYAVFIGRAVQTVTPPANINIQLADGTAAAPSLNFANDTNTGIFRPTTDTIAFTEGGAEAMRIDSSGNVGIGTSSPVLTSANRGNVTINGSAGSILNLAYGGSAAALFYADNTLGKFGTYTSIPLLFATGDTERMRITAAGALCVGGSNANGPSIISSTSASSGTACYANLNTAGAGSHFHYFINSTNSAIIGSITNNGNTGTAFNTSSDYRLKENVNYNFDATTRLKQLKPARFNFIANPNKTVDGFLAHEVQDIIPEAITGTKDQVEAIGNITDVEGNIIRENVTEPNELLENQTWTQTGTRPVHQGIDQAKLTPLLTKALQEAIARIEQLEATLTFQQTKIDSLEARLTALES